MNLLSIDGLSKQFSERVLFEEAHLQINEGDRIGLIGVNGSGKSTLLKIAAGIEPADRGRVSLVGGVRVEYLAQEPQLDDAFTVLETIFRSDSPQMALLRHYEAVTEQLQAQPDDRALQQRLTDLSAEMDRTAGWTAEANAKAVLTRLGIIRFDALVATLSGGQRKRVALARALIDRADLLILDEPTNHIDAQTVAWLEEYLASTPGALLMVTHDRYFLDRVVNRIVELDRRQLVSYAGNYADYLAARDQRHLRLAQAEQKRQKMIKRELEWLRRSPMARSTKQKARKQRVEEMLQIQYDAGDDRVALALAARRLGKQVLAATGLTKSYDTMQVLDGVDFRLEPGDRIGIVGANGAGKSTLLDVLAGTRTCDAGQIQWGETVQLGYYDQQSVDLDDRLRLIEFIENEAPVIRTDADERVDAAQMLEWFLFPRAMQYARIGSLSGGERRRLYLLRTLVHQPNVLFLDEPTNDLDIQTLTVLEEFLDHFAGCLVVVSHDRYFLDRTVDYIMQMDGGRIGPRLPGPYTTFARMYAEMYAAVAVPPQPEPDRPGGTAQHDGSRGAAAKTGRPRRLSWREQQELAALEHEIEVLEEKKARIERDMATSGNDYVRLTELAGHLQDVDARLDDKLLRWMELQEILEAQ